MKRYQITFQFPRKENFPFAFEFLIFQSAYCEMMHESRVQLLHVIITFRYMYS